MFEVGNRWKARVAGTGLRTSPASAGAIVLWQSPSPGVSEVSEQTNMTMQDGALIGVMIIA
jgi:hypothetical protein